MNLPIKIIIRIRHDEMRKGISFLLNKAPENIEIIGVCKTLEEVETVMQTNTVDFALIQYSTMREDYMNEIKSFSKNYPKTKLITLSASTFSHPKVLDVKAGAYNQFSLSGEISDLLEMMGFEIAVK